MSDYVFPVFSFLSCPYLFLSCKAKRSSCWRKTALTTSTCLRSKVLKTLEQNVLPSLRVKRKQMSGVNNTPTHQRKVKTTQSAYTNNWFKLINVSPYFFSFTFRIAYPNSKFKSTGDKASHCFNPLHIWKLRILLIGCCDTFVVAEQVSRNSESYQDDVCFFCFDRIVCFIKIN